MNKNKILLAVSPGLTLTCLPSAGAGLALAGAAAGGVEGAVACLGAETTAGRVAVRCSRGGVGIQRFSK